MLKFKKNNYNNNKYKQYKMIIKSKKQLSHLMIKLLTYRNKLYNKNHNKFKYNKRLKQQDKYTTLVQQKIVLIV